MNNEKGDIKTNDPSGENNTKGFPDPVPDFDPAEAVGDMPTPTESAVPPEMGDTETENKRARSKSRAKSTRRGRPSKAERLKNEASAEMVVGGLDMMRNAIGGLTPDPKDATRQAAVEAWSRYFEETGKEPPAWAVCVIVSTVYVAPAFSTEKGKGLFGRVWERVKIAYATRKAKK